MDTPAPVMVTISELARLRGVTRQTMTEQVDRLERLGRLATQKVGRKRMVDAAAVRIAIGHEGDPEKEMGAETKRADNGAASSADPSAVKFRDAKTTVALIDARTKALALAQARGRVVPVTGAHGVEAGLVQAGEALVRSLERIMTWSQDLFDAGLVSDQMATRRLLRDKVDMLRADIAATLERAAGEADAAAKAGAVSVDLDIDMGDDG